ncbi:hypothetical protein KCP75_14530 [Salmonella enterica subsp. enterica]|nr:hypothetical protein KCP75_14530 [Salmonella enterica subsp. enterica]
MPRKVFKFLSTCHRAALVYRDCDFAIADVKFPSAGAGAEKLSFENVALSVAHPLVIGFICFVLGGDAVSTGTVTRKSFRLPVRAGA